MNFEIPDKYKCFVKSDRSLKSNVSKEFQDYIVSLYNNKFNFKLCNRTGYYSWIFIHNNSLHKLLNSKNF